MATPKHAVKILFKNGQSEIVNVPDPWVFITALTDQLANAKSASSYWNDPTAPLLILASDVLMAIAVTREDK